ncbi:Acetylornithine deacetylase/Succinyl-diaminopimelate desuccinylase [Hymenobacter gelipurpurascens]|uniref:Acetylornithine deacetylase/Succinyl-diaminopimelate desuccinylase n=1 Tax=Hymenobacter gelipurpurascens TaxID=89968 RepID=A0A212UHW7_9BACT|nr:M20/M25/M40 family metallo-hydrolase [Hymenobacter gelipurpurascens]SNC77654.1 Acetylornithine deacetylase/Succinyl-diaminopimelate desuccinylase [Hymenobacter gelipurpurascens]
MKKTYLASLLLLLALLSFSAPDSSLRKVRQYREAHEQPLLAEFMQLLTIPNVAADSAGLRQTARFIAGMMQKRGIKTQLLPATTAGVPPAVYGEVRTPGAKRTLIFYAHYDGQPVNPAQWAAGLSPFKPQLMSTGLGQGGKPLPLLQAGEKTDPNWRIYGRSSSDDKAGVMAILAGYEALVQSGQRPSVNLKFFFEGEEEKGSPHLSEIVEGHRALLASDLWIICDGPVHQSGQKQVVFGARGDVNVGLTVYGATRPLHSGHYGNWAPNPALELAQLLGSMKDTTGRVTIAGFYDDVIPLTPLEKQALSRVPNLDATIQQELGFARANGAGQSLNELINQPSLNINGLRSAQVGTQAANVIPTTAEATLDLRLVLGNDSERQVAKVVRHIQRQGYFVTSQEPTAAERARYPRLVRVSPQTGYNAERTPMDLPVARSVVAAVQRTSTQPVVQLPTSGGSLPLHVFKRIGATTLTVPVANYDNNQHAENENIRLGNLWEGLETMAAIMQLQ